MIVMKIHSIFCRGWEGNRVEFVETDGTIEELVLSDLRKDYDDPDMTEEDLWNEVEEVDGEFHRDGDEIQTTYKVFTPDLLPN